MSNKIDFFKHNKLKISIIGFLFVTSIAISHVIAFVCFPTKYVSELQLTTKRDIGDKQMQTLVEIVKSDSPVQDTCSKLAEKGIHHSNGTPISAGEIKNGLSDWYTNRSAIISIYFYTTDASIAKYVLDTHIETSISYIEEGMTYIKDQIVISSYASNPEKAANNRYQIIIGLPIIVGVLGFGFLKAGDVIEKRRRRKIAI